MTQRAPFLGKSVLGRRMVAVALLAGVGLSLIFSGFNLWSKYHQGEEQILREVNQLISALQPQLEHSIWDVDHDSVQRILFAISANPNVSSVQILESDTTLPMLQSSDKPVWQKLQFELKKVDELHSDRKLGVLRVDLSLEHFKSTLGGQFFTTILEVFFKYILLALVISGLFHRLVTEPLRKIQAAAGEFNQKHFQEFASSPMSADLEKNEIEELQKSIFELQENFIKAFAQVSTLEKERTQVEMDLFKERQKIKLTQRLETIGQITTQVVHDFGNIMMIINGKSQLLERNLEDEKLKKLTHDIRKSADRAQNLIKKILKMTRFQESELQMIDPGATLMEMKDLLETAIGSHIQLEVHLEGDSGLIHVDPSNFENALINLCVNARDAMPDGGQINISVKSLSKAGMDYVSVSVQDSGTGIPEHLREKVFEPYFTTKASGKGTGLGLPQIQEFSVAAGGYIDLKTGSSGTCISLFLPNKKTQVQTKTAS